MNLHVAVDLALLRKAALLLTVSACAALPATRVRAPHVSLQKVGVGCKHMFVEFAGRLKGQAAWLTAHGVTPDTLKHLRAHVQSTVDGL